LFIEQAAVSFTNKEEMKKIIQKQIHQDMFNKNHFLNFLKNDFMFYC